MLGDRLISNDCANCNRSFQTLYVVKEIDKKMPDIKFKRISKIDEDNRALLFIGEDGSPVEFVVEYSGDRCLLRYRSGTISEKLWTTIGVAGIKPKTEFGIATFISRLLRAFHK